MAELRLRRLQPWSLSIRFAVASALVLLAGAALLGTWVTRQIEESVLHRAAASSAMYVEALVGPPIRTANLTAQWSYAQRTLGLALADLTRDKGVISIKVWAPDGTVLFATDPTLVGRVFAPSGLPNALRGEIVSGRNRLDQEENVSERSLATEVIETYIPVRDEPTGQVIAVVEFYQATDLLDADLAQARVSTWVLIALATAVMYLLLFDIVRMGSDTIERQRRQLAEAFHELSLTTSRLREASAARAETDEASLRRVARELHDGLAQDLAAALITMNGDGGRNGMARAAIESALGEVRALASGLAAPDLAPLGLAEVVDQACGEHERKTGQMVGREVGELLAVAPEPVKIALYRVLQESLSNAFRHAGPGAVRVRATAGDGVLRIECLDDGPGITAKCSRGLGLRSMRERIELLDGSFSVGRRPSGGTIVRAEIPLERPREAAG